MVKITPDTVEKTAAAVKTAQIIQLIKDNQLMTALVLFVFGRLELSSRHIPMFKEECVNGSKKDYLEER